MVQLTLDVKDNILATVARYMFNVIIHLVCFFMLVFTGKSLAIDVVYSAGATVGRYQNVNLEYLPVSDEVVKRVDGDISIREDGSRFMVNLDAYMEIVDYQNNLVTNEDNGEMEANLVWRIYPQQFDWIVNDVYTQATINSLNSNTRDNLQNINVFSTGPNYYIRFDSLNNIELESRVSIYNYELDLDNKRGMFSARWVYRLNPAVSMSGNAQFEAVDYDNDTQNIDFDRNDAFARFSYVRGLNTAELEYGLTRILTNEARDIDESRYLLDFTNRRNHRATLGFSYERLLSDTSREVFDSADNLASADAIYPLYESALNDIYREQIYMLSYNVVQPHAAINFQLTSTDREYFRLFEFNEESDRLGIELVRNVSQRVFLRFLGLYEESSFPDLSVKRNDIDKIYSLIAGYRVTRNTLIQIESTIEERDSSEETASYDDKRMFLSLRYQVH